jgi:hypothetical protein
MSIALLSAVSAWPAHAQAQSGEFGDWVFGIDTALTAASTGAADGSRYGMVCGQNCLIYIESDRRCREGALYTGTSQSSARNFDVQWRCHHLEGRSVLTAVPNEDFMAVISQCAEVTFSVALEEEHPDVFRFSLGGAYEAISRALEGAIAIVERRQQPDPATPADEAVPPSG